MRKSSYKLQNIILTLFQFITSITNTTFHFCVPHNQDAKKRKSVDQLMNSLCIPIIHKLNNLSVYEPKNCNTNIWEVCKMNHNKDRCNFVICHIPKTLVFGCLQQFFGGSYSAKGSILVIQTLFHHVRQTENKLKTDLKTGSV